MCIPWETLSQCIELSLDNSQRLLEDAEFLVTKGRLSSAKALVITSLEESGKALLGCESLATRKKIPAEIYKSKFLNHRTKIGKALEAAEDLISTSYPGLCKASGGNASERQLLEEKLESFFVDYDGQRQVWTIPWSRDPRPLVRAGSMVFSLKSAKKLRRLEEQFDKSILSILVDIAKTANSNVRNRYKHISG